MIKSLLKHPTSQCLEAAYYALREKENLLKWKVLTLKVPLSTRHVRCCRAIKWYCKKIILIKKNHQKIISEQYRCFSLLLMMNTIKHLSANSIFCNLTTWNPSPYPVFTSLSPQQFFMKNTVLSAQNKICDCSNIHRTWRSCSSCCLTSHYPTG